MRNPWPDSYYEKLPKGPLPRAVQEQLYTARLEELRREGRLD